MRRTLSKIDTTVLDNIIVGRVEPHIYAFSTETVPNYLKVGDTYRSVRVRLDEWRKIFPNLIKHYEHSAQIDADTIFRDYAVHTFLERERNRERLQPHSIENLHYYSREFFKDATTNDVEAAIKDIVRSARDNSGKYPLYSPDRLPQTFTYERKENFLPRDNQQQAIDKFKAAIEAGRRNLLLYAVMRFGKSFTSMCCAKEMNARFVVIVSAKADVKEEWKKTIESHVYFEGFSFLDSESLKSDDSVIATTLSDPNKRVALFLTLQDLQGPEIKEKHKEVFGHQIDLLIIDETHFGVRGESLGKVLRAQRLSKSEIKRELKGLDGFETLDSVEDAVKTLDAKIRLHLSGTPYRILMSDEFQKEDIIAFVQFTDIIDAQQQWNNEHLKDDDCDEWENPYFGFPQMIRFAFNPNESSRKKMEQLRKDGITYAFSELFRPLTMNIQSDGSHRKFKHEAEILDLLEVIDGSKEDDNLLGFLNYDKIKDGKMCRHIVCVLPFRASCDAMASLINQHRDRFKNLCDYEIINIAGFDDERKYKSTEDVKRIIKECESHNKKTLTLTVNRMLTGTTVPRWDTMLYLKGTASPQEYDQAIFRLQNQYITTFKDESGKIIKYNMKPQTLLVDFDPNRMFVLQELKSQFYNVNSEVQGNSQLKERIAKELVVSPIIVLNKNKLQQATPTNITDAVREYSRTRSILDDATDIPADNELLQDEELAGVLRLIQPIDSKSGLHINPTENEDGDLDIPEGVGSDNHQNDTDTDGNTPATSNQQKEPIEKDQLEKRLAAFYARLLFFAFLTDSTVKSLQEVIEQIPTTEDNQRIAKNLGLRIGILKLIQVRSNPFVLQKLDYKIENVNDLMRDTSLSAIKRVEIAMRKFGRMSESEIVTPLNVANDMVALLPEDVFSYGPVLDIASKQGEFTIALLNRYGTLVGDKIYSVCTSKLAYEFTRKVYKLLSLPIDHIFDSFTSYDLIKKDKNNSYKYTSTLENMNISSIIGNPPYQVKNEGRGNGSDPLYHEFIDLGKFLSSISILIHPGKFLFNAGKTPKKWNQSITQDPHIRIERYWLNSSDVFSSIELPGGIAISHYNKFENYGKIGSFSPYKELLTIAARVKAASKHFISSIVSPREYYGVTNNLYEENPEFDGRYSKGHKYSLGANIFDTFPEVFFENVSHDRHENFARVFGRINNQRGYKYINRDYITHPDNFYGYKVLFPKADGAAGQIGKPVPARILGKTDILKPFEAYTDTFIAIGNFSSLEEGINCQKYVKTKFARALLGLLKVTQMVTRETWANVPMQDFTSNSDIDWSKDIDEIDAQLYAKYKLTSDEILFIESMIKPM